MLILPPQSVGETVALYAPVEYSCGVTAPDGSYVLYQTPTKRTDIPLTQVGTYHYAYSDGSTGEIEVVAAVEPKPPVVP